MFIQIFFKQCCLMESTSTVLVWSLYTTCIAFSKGFKNIIWYLAFVNWNRHRTWHGMTNISMLGFLHIAQKHFVHFFMKWRSKVNISDLNWLLELFFQNKGNFLNFALSIWIFSKNNQSSFLPLTVSRARVRSEPSSFFTLQV